MQQQIFLPKRLKNGEVVVNRLYRGRYRHPGDSKPREISLGTMTWLEWSLESTGPLMGKGISPIGLCGS